MGFIYQILTQIKVNLFCCFRRDGSDQSSDKLFITNGWFYFNTTVIRNV